MLNIDYRFKMQRLLLQITSIETDKGGAKCLERGCSSLGSMLLIPQDRERSLLEAQRRIEHLL